MAAVGELRYIYFRLSDLSDNPVTGRVQADFSIIFTRDDVACTDVLTISELGGGRYEAKYTPSRGGVDYVEIYDAATSIRLTDVEVVEGGHLVDLNQDYPTPGALRMANAGNSTLYIFLYDDWQAGRQSTEYAKGQARLDRNGNWISPIYLMPGTYTVIVTDGTTTTVIAPSLTLN